MKHVVDFKRFSINEDDSQLAFDFGEIKPLPGDGKMMSATIILSPKQTTVSKILEVLSKYNLGIKNVEFVGEYPTGHALADDYSFDMFGKAEDIKRLLTDVGYPKQHWELKDIDM